MRSSEASGFTSGLGLVLAGVLTACSAETDARARETGAAPVVRVTTFEELVPAVEAYRGRAVLLNFWATWCEPCVAELPDLVEVGAAFEGRDAEVVLVSYDYMVPGPDERQALELVQRFLTGRRIPFDCYVFDDADYDRVNEWLDLPGPIPATVAIDAQGKVVDRQTGRAGRARFEEMMERALGR